MASVVNGFEHLHEDLGRLVGVSSAEDIVQFRGIPYADIPGRFRQSVLKTTLGTEPFDATKTGPACPQSNLPYPEFWSEPPSSNSWVPPPAQEDEFSCLNLNVTGPRTTLSSSQKLPVLVFIHGGAFVGGSHAVQVSGREIYDATNLVRDSIARDRGIIVVTINYRVGPLGFLASKELADYNKSYDEAVGNYGLHDQRQALEWISRYIGGFGGDSGNVTIHGSSAGASSCHYQSIFPTRKFRRAILASGTLTGIGPETLEQHQLTFDKLKFSICEGRRTNSETIQCIQQLPVEKLISTVALNLYNPLIDGTWISSGHLDSIGLVDDPPEMMAGSCSFEQELVEFLFSDPSTMKPLPSNLIIQQAKSMISSSGMLSTPEVFPEKYLSVIRSYSISQDDGETTLSSWAPLVSDITFRIPPLHLARSPHTNKTLIFDFQATNPFPKAGKSYGKANHAVNDLFLFDVARDLVPEQHYNDWIGAVNQLRKVWLDFCYGIQHWKPMKKKDAGDEDDLGPIYAFVNGGDGASGPTREVVGEVEAQRWTDVLYVCR